MNLLDLWQSKQPTVAEAFDQPYPFKWEKSMHGDYDALVKLPDGTNLSIMFNGEYKNHWMVEFYRSNSQEITGEGDAQRIFATVLHAIQQFIKKKKPKSIFFTAVKEDDPTGSRTKLYNRLVQRFAGGLGYTLTTQADDYGTSYKLVRIKNVKPGVAEGMDILDPFTRNVLNRMEDDSWLSAEHAYFITKGIQKKHQTNPDAYNQEIQRFIDLYKKYKGQQGVAESQTAKAGIVQTDVYGTRAYHAKCLEPGCDWESKRYDRIQQAQAAAKKHGETHFDKKAVAEGLEQKMSVKDTLEYLQKVMGTASHEDWRNHIVNTNEYFVLKQVPVSSLKSDLSGLNKDNVEKYKQMDFSKAPPIVIGSDGNILDGYHRVNVAKALRVPTLKAWVGVKKQGVAENFADGKVKGKSRPGRVKRAGASCSGSVTDLRARAKKYGGEKGKMYHWCANMKSGKQK